MRREMIARFESRFAGFDGVILPTTLNTPPAIAAQFPQFPVTNNYAELKAAVQAAAIG